jgi:hypothetical protein
MFSRSFVPIRGSKPHSFPLCVPGGLGVTSSSFSSSSSKFIKTENEGQGRGGLLAMFEVSHFAFAHRLDCLICAQ